MRVLASVGLVVCLAAVPFGCRGGGLALRDGFEAGARGTRPPEFWHRAGGDYLSAFPDWVLAAEGVASGRRCVTSTSGREFIVCGEGAAGNIEGSVALRAATAGTKVRIRLSWWNRLTRADATKEVEVGTTWQRFAVATEARQTGPMELAVRSLGVGTRIWADDFRIDGAPMPDQLVEALRQGDKITRRTVPVVRPEPIDLARLQGYSGTAADHAGKVTLTVDVPQECVGVPCVSGGVPFPRGRLFRRDRVRVVDEQGRGVPAQFDVLSRWHAGQSIMVLLVTVPTPAATQRLTLAFGPDVSPAPVPALLTIAGVPSGRVVTPTVVGAHGEAYAVRKSTTRVERAGPLCAVVAREGELRDPKGKRCGRCVMRCTTWRGSPKVGVSFCWINDQRDAAVPIQSMRLDLRCTVKPGKKPSITQVAVGKAFHASGDPVAAPPAPEAAQTRETGLVAGRLAVRDFWQNHPCGVETAEDGYRVWLWPASVRGVLMSQGIARQWDLLLDPQGSLTRPYQTDRLPVLAADPAWMCASGVFEFLLPPDPKAFPIFEQRVGSMSTLGRFAREQKESRNLYGVFNYGDAPGDGGWSNLESMAAHELFLHWLRTGSREHFDMARLAAEHYRDVDIHHGGGFCHTHCNNHTASSEGWSHSWIQGVRDLYFLLGDLRALDVLGEVGERLLTKPAGWTSGRDWTRPMDNLVDIFGATGDTRYLDCARRHMLELRKRQVPEHAVCGAERNSWYEDRYAAGCAFTWYGCQAMAKLHQQTADPEVLDILRREIDLSLDVQTKARRSFNILPGERVGADHQAVELDIFALGRGSTLFPPLGYLAEATGDRGYLDLGMRVLAHYMLNLRSGSDASATSYATMFLHYAKRAGIGPAEEAAAFQRARDYSHERWPQGVANGGFEMDHFAHWGVKKVPGQDFYYDKLVRVGYYLDDTMRRSGRRSLRLHSDNRGRTMFVRGRFALAPRRRYRASVWVKANDTMNPVVGLSLRAYDTDWRGGVALRPVGEPQDGWQQHAGEFLTTQRTVATWTLCNRGGTGDAWFDDVAIDDLGPVYRLLTNNGGGRDWRKPTCPDLAIDTGGAYLPDKQMSTDTEPEGTPIPFTVGCLTDGNAKYDYRQKPRGAYAYWTKRDRGSITFDLKRPCRIRQVRLNVLIDAKRKAHGAQRIELHQGDAAGPLLGHIDPAHDGWNEFGDLDVTAQRLTLVLTRLKGRAYLTVSEIEIWGEGERKE